MCVERNRGIYPCAHRTADLACLFALSDGIAKVKAEELMRAAGEEHGFEVVAINPGVCIGPNEPRAFHFNCHSIASVR